MHVRSILAGLLVLLLAGGARAETVGFRNVTVIDVAGGRRLPGRVVLVEGRRIVAVGDAATARRARAGTRWIDGRGRFLVPGFWDMHAHVCNDSITSLTARPLLLAHGVTGVRDMAGALASVLAWRDAARRGTRVSPRAFVAGPVIDGAPPATTGDITIRTPEEARRAVDSLAHAGVDFIKMYEMLRPDAFRALVDEAKRHGLKVAGHLPLAVDAQEASAAGVASFEHLRNLELACARSADSLREARTAWLDTSLTADGRALRGRILNAQRPVALEHEDPARRHALLEALAKNHTWQVPTLFLDEAPLVLADTVALRRVRVAAAPYVSAEVRQWWDDTARGYAAAPPESRERAARVARWQRAFVRDLRDAGVGILAGSDMPNLLTAPGFSLHEELRALRDAGLTNLEALRSATLDPARFFGATDSLGTVEVGKRADLVLLDADPLEDMRNTARIRSVVADGRLLRREDLDALLAEVRRIVSGN